MKFTVQLIRTVLQIKEVEVEAASMDEAGQRALDLNPPLDCHDDGWHEELDDEWEVDSSTRPWDIEVNDTWAS
ncbi:MAG: hypothetical protein HQM01_11440 [Magnetococcales bacterium]|nr:hypothetical protein [Magnetococcales bacterium]MBF0297021.1 hypothetical protein [Magnetococcales bacterium]